MGTQARYLPPYCSLRDPYYLVKDFEDTLDDVDSLSDTELVIFITTMMQANLKRLDNDQNFQEVMGKLSKYKERMLRSADIGSVEAILFKVCRSKLKLDKLDNAMPLLDLLVDITKTKGNQQRYIMYACLFASSNLYATGALGCELKVR